MKLDFSHRFSATVFPWLRGHPSRGATIRSRRDGGWRSCSRAYDHCVAALLRRRRVRARSRPPRRHHRGTRPVRGWDCELVPPTPNARVGSLARNHCSAGAGRFLRTAAGAACLLTTKARSCLGEDRAAAPWLHECGLLLCWWSMQCRISVRWNAGQVSWIVSFTYWFCSCLRRSSTVYACISLYAVSWRAAFGWVYRILKRTTACLSGHAVSFWQSTCGNRGHGSLVAKLLRYSSSLGYPECS